jgi:hypothetical protein
LNNADFRLGFSKKKRRGTSFLAVTVTVLFWSFSGSASGVELDVLKEASKKVEIGLAGTLP